MKRFLLWALTILLSLPFPSFALESLTGSALNAGSDIVEYICGIGFWHAAQGPIDANAERFAFFHDGSFLYGYSEFNGMERLRFKAGQWRVTDGVLTLTVEKKLFLEGGRSVNDALLGEMLEGGEARLVIPEPPEIEAYAILNTGCMPGTDRETLMIGDKTYYSATAQFDMMIEYFQMFTEALKGEARAYGFGMAGDLWVQAFAERALETGLSLELALRDKGADYADYTASRGDVELLFADHGGIANNFYISLDFHDLSEREQAEALETFHDIANIAVYVSEGGGSPEIIDEIMRTLCRGFDEAFPEHFSAAHALGACGEYRIQLHPCEEDDDSIFLELYAQRFFE